MTKSMTKKRLEEIEIKLTSKEWAIQLVDEMRKYPTETDFLKTMAQGVIQDSLIWKPFLKLAEQAEKCFSGKKPENIRARYHLDRKLQTEWHMLKNLIFTVNENTNNQVESTGLKTALKLSTLQAIILQDTLGLTAGKAALWVEKCKVSNKDDANNRQVLLKELADFRDDCLCRTFSFPLKSNGCIFLPVHIENWMQDITILMSDIFTHEAAIKIIQDKYFDGHPILFQDAENRLNEAVKMLKDGVTTFNEYMKVRKALFNAERDQKDRIVSVMPGKREDQLIIEIEDIKIRAIEQNAATLANAWIKYEKEKAIADFLEEGEYENYLRTKFREMVGFSS